MPSAPELTTLPSVETLSYPFPSHGMTAPEARSVDEALDALQDRFGLFESPAKSFQTVAGFARLCSVPGLPRETVFFVTELLALIVYFNDRVGKPGCEAELDESLSALLAPAGAENTGSAARASADLARRLAPHLDRAPHNAVPLLQAISDTWSAFRWESERLDQLPRTMDDYERLRMKTIAVQPYLRCFRLLMGVPAASVMKGGHLLSTAEWLATRVQYLANDLGSVSRDLARGQRNAVLLLASAGNIPLDAAWQQAQALHDEAVDELSQCLANLRARDAAPALQRYADELEACTWGNLQALTMLAKRYSREAPEL